MKKYKSYVFKDQDPIVRTTLALVDASFAEAARRSGVSAGTLTNWRSKKTRRPQFCTLNAVGRAFGFTLAWKKK